ncbi:MAG: rhomboid family intramembrane serine protease [Mangrovibacterium sp.]
MSITLGIIIVTSLVSYMAFSRYDLMARFQFNVSRVLNDRQYYRLISYSFLHGSWSHLLINMFVLYSFGSAVEKSFSVWFGVKSNIIFFLLYFGAIVFCNLRALFKHRNNSDYNAVGASGGVSAVLFASILFSPWRMIYFFGILPIPGIVFGFLYLYYSYYMDGKNRDNVAHDAHFLGAIFGFIYPIVVQPEILNRFLNELMSIF